MQRKGFFLLALLCGLIAAGSTYLYLKGMTRNPSSPLKPIVVAKTNISARTVIQASQLMLKDVPSQSYPQGGFSSLQSVEGSVALVNLSAGDSVVSSMLQRPQTENASNSNLVGNGTALAVPEGKRAVAIPISLVSGVGYTVKPGDHVDVLVTMDIKDSAGNNQTITALAVQDAMVLNVGESLTGDKNKVDSKSYTLALSVPQAMAVTYGSEKGSLRLLLRNPANKDIQQDAPFMGNMFLDPNYVNKYK